MTDTQHEPQKGADIMTAAEAARYLRVSETWLRASNVPRARFGRRIVFLRSELLAYAEARLTSRVSPVSTVRRVS